MMTTTEMMTTIVIIAVGVSGLVLGVLWGRAITLDRAEIYRLQVRAARRFAGKLGDRIGRQKRIINELKKQLKAISATTPALAKPTNRPNLPH